MKRANPLSTKRSKTVGWVLFIIGWITLISGIVWAIFFSPSEEKWWLAYLVWIVSAIISAYLIALGARLADINWTIKGYMPQDYGS